MSTIVTPVDRIEPITRDEAPRLAATENQRVLDLLAGLDDEAWTRPTDCPPWDVRAMSGHVLGSMEGFASTREFIRQLRGATRSKGDGPLVDGMTAFQIAERADQTRAQILERLATAGPRAARWRSRIPAPMRRMTMKEEVGGVSEKWRVGYLLDVILTRDTWMHRVDVSRATGREMVLTADHDGRIVADVVAEWARRHGQPFTLHLEGPAGGTFTAGEDRGGEEITIDAVELCRILSGRGSGDGLLAQPVPF